MAKRVTVTYGRTLDNRDNLDEDTVDTLLSVYEGTRFGRQELDGELLESFGALLDEDTIHQFRVSTPPELSRTIVSLDPSITATEESDAAGILVLGADDQETPHGYVLDDRTLESATFGQWAEASVKAFLDYDADYIVAEINQGGGGIEEAIQVAASHAAERLGLRELVVPVHTVWARKSKRARAEPVSALYERGRIHHVGVFKDLEKEWSGWMPGMESPNRMDACVHGFTNLLLGDRPEVGPISSYWS